ncbi:single-stranded DNA-binding protein [Microbacterium paraoxydans]|uniref:single-stranded DNA-binding protein n=1 Tax=Microbacterium paraoxydans TaxID=199592 RepID=UPI003013B125
MIDTVTIVGRVATEPTPGRTSAGVPVTNFRLASTHRRFDAASGSWVDAGTNWFSIAAFRQLAEHARASLRVGDSVIVSGRLRVRPWESNGKQGTSVDIDADTIGHDLRWGTTAYRPSTRPSPPDAEESGDDPTTDGEGRDAWEQPVESEAA